MGSFALVKAQEGRQLRAATRPETQLALSTCFSIELLQSSQAEQLQNLFFRLDRETRCRRFGHAITNDGLKNHVAKSFESASCIFGAFQAGDLRGALEVYTFGNQGWAETALVVEQAWRRRGAAWQLLQEAKTWALHQGAGKLRLIFARDNWPMRQLAHKAEARFDITLDEMCADVPVGQVS